MERVLETSVQWSSWLSQLGWLVLIQSTIVLPTGLVLAKVFAHRGSAIESVILRATLVLTVVCPVLSLAIRGSDWRLEIIDLPSAYAAIDVLEKTDEPVLKVPEPIVLNPPKIETSVSAETLDPVIISRQSADHDQQLPEPAPWATADQDRHLAAALPTDAESIAANRVGTNSTRRVSVAGWLYIVLSAFWVLVALVMVLRLGRGLVAQKALLRHTYPLNVQDKSIVKEISDQFQIRLPIVRRHPALAGPCLVGLSSPWILLPSENTDSGAMRRILLHEICHLKRGDLWWNLGQRVALSLLFFQPLLWRLIQRLEATAENVCDDFVLQGDGDRASYAAQLFELAASNVTEAWGPSIAFLGVKRTLLKGRIERILNANRILHRGLSPLGWTLIGLIILPVGLLSATMQGSNYTAQSGELVAKESSQAAIVEDEQMIVIAGRVIDPSGQPAGGANVVVRLRYRYAFQWPSTLGLNQLDLASTTSATDGSFQLSFPQSELVASGMGGIEKSQNYVVIASKPGFGVSWKSADEFPSASADNPGHFAGVDLALAPDETKLLITVKDSDGRPVVDATLFSEGIHQIKPVHVSGMFKTWTNWEQSQGKFQSSLLGWSQEFGQTDANGQLCINEIGDDRLVHLVIRHPEYATERFRQATVVVSAAKNQETTSVPDATSMIFGAESTIELQPDIDIQGVVVDRKTKEPVAGVLLVSRELAGQFRQWNTHVQAISDDQGRFLMSGMGRGAGNVIVAIPKDGLPYFMKQIRLPDSSNVEAQPITIELDRGIMIQGRVTELETGNPIRDASVHYLGYASNQHFADLPSFRNEIPNDVSNRYVTNADGDFQVIGLPGLGVVGLSAVGNHSFYPKGQGINSLDARLRTPGSRKVWDFNLYIGQSKHTDLPKFLTAVKTVEIGDQENMATVDFSITREGTRSFLIRDSDGNPLINTVAFGLRSRHGEHVSVTEPQATITGLLAGESRLVRIEHPASGLARIVEMSAAPDGGQPGALDIVTLVPQSKVSGQLVDEQGNPIAKVQIMVQWGDQSLNNPTTDAEGKFEFSAPMGTKYRISWKSDHGIANISNGLEVFGSERIELGKLVANRKNVVEPKRAPLK